MSNKNKFQGLLERKAVSNTNLQETINTVIVKGKNQNEDALPKKKATFELDLELHTELKIIAAKQNKKMVDIVELALREYLSINK